MSLLLDHVKQNAAQRMRRAGAAWPGAWGASHEGRVGEGKGEQAEALGREGLQELRIFHHTPQPFLG